MKRILVPGLLAVSLGDVHLADQGAGALKDAAGQLRTDLDRVGSFVHDVGSRC